MKFKNLTKKQIIISIDRLTRFKPTEEKYLRVFTDIILSNLIEPKIKKVDVEEMDYQKIKDIAVQIFNASFDIVNKDLSVNHKLRIYENSTFENDENVQKLLDNELDYNSALSLVDDDCDVLNLKWLKSLKIDDDMNITGKNIVYYIQLKPLL